MSDAGKIYLFTMPFYDIRIGKMSYKARPAMVLYGPRNNDYTVLPVSTIKRTQRTWMLSTTSE